MILDIMELEMRKETIEERLESTGDEEPEILAHVKQEIKDRRDRLLLQCGEENFEVLVALTDRVNREGIGMVADAEEDATLTEEEARVWRRRLDSRRKNRIQNAAYATHNTGTSTSKQAAWDVPTDRSEDELSYFQRQQRKYGRGRRGSTSFAGAFDKLFQASGEAADEEGEVDEVFVTPPALADAIETSKAGDVDPLCTLAVELAVQLKTLQKDSMSLQAQLRRSTKKPKGTSHRTGA